MQFQLVLSYGECTMYRELCSPKPRPLLSLSLISTLVHCTLCSKQKSYKCFPSPGPDYGTKVLAKLTEFNGCLSASFALSESEVANLQSKYT